MDSNPSRDPGAGSPDGLSADLIPSGASLPLRVFLGAALWMSYMLCLLIDNFDALLVLTLLIFLVLRPLRVMPWRAVALQLVLLFIASRCFYFELIEEGKMFVIYISGLSAGLMLAPVIAAQSKVRSLSFISLAAALVYILRSFGYEISPTIDSYELLNNLAEIAVFNLLAVSYLRDRERGAAESLFLLPLSILSASKFLIINSTLLVLSKRQYLVVLSLMMIFILLFNPFGSFDSRLSLYAIFFDNISFSLLSFGKLTSVNDLVILEATIYSFHSIWMDYLWLGGIVGVGGIWMHFSIIFDMMRRPHSASEERGKLAFMYFICVTFGVSLFFGTKYMMLMLGVMLFKNKARNYSRQLGLRALTSPP